MSGAGRYRTLCRAIRQPDIGLSTCRACGAQARPPSCCGEHQPFHAIADMADDPHRSHGRWASQKRTSSVRRWAASSRRPPRSGRPPGAKYDPHRPPPARRVRTTEARPSGRLSSASAPPTAGRRSRPLATFEHRLPGYPVDIEQLRSLAARSLDRAFDPDGSPPVGCLPSPAGSNARPAPPAHADCSPYHGLSDPLVAPSSVGAWRRRSSGSEVRRLSGMGHDLPRQLWGSFAGEIITLSDRTPAARAQAGSSEPAKLGQCRRLGAGALTGQVGGDTGGTHGGHHSASPRL